MLHTVNKSPFERNTLSDCLNRAVKGSAILLYEDAVYAALQGTAISQRMSDAAKDHEVYVLTPDLQARGVKDAPLIAGIQAIDYTGFVKLVADKGTTTPWF